MFVLCTSESCDDVLQNKTALQEQSRTEVNQAQLNENQSAPRITWSLERDNLINDLNFKITEQLHSLCMYLFKV